MAAAKEETKVRKISVKSVCGKTDPAVVLSKKKIDLMDVFGIAGRQKAITTDYGDSIKFVGQFKAINLETGEIFVSSTLFLPKSLEDELSGAMSGGSNAQFGFRMSANYDNDLPTLYYYDAVDIIKPVNSDALKQLEDSVMTNRKALPPPKKG